MAVTGLCMGYMYNCTLLVGAVTYSRISFHVKPEVRAKELTTMCSETQEKTM